VIHISNSMRMLPETQPLKPSHFQEHQFRQLYPSLLTLSLFAIYCYNFLTGVLLAQETNARFWVGEIGYAVLIIPVLLVLAHIWQAAHRRPLYPCLVLTCVVPGLLCLFVGFQYEGGISLAAARLLSTDCTTFKTKFIVQQAYQEADMFFDHCLANQATNLSTTVEEARKTIVISQCPGYTNAKALGFAREWNYLEALEKHEHCAGWCFDGEKALWTHNPESSDSCSAAAGVTMETKVLRNVSRLQWTGLASAGVGVLLLFAINEAYRRLGEPIFGSNL